MDIKKHLDTIAILGAFACGMLWMNGKFNDFDKEIACIKQELAVIKTVLFLKDILPKELAKEAHDKT